jgi:hypothetical protein
MDSLMLTKMAEEYENIRRDRMKRFLQDAAVSAAGMGLGYGVGSAAGRLSANKIIKNKYTPAIMALLGAGGGLLSSHLARTRERYRDEPLNKS